MQEIHWNMIKILIDKDFAYQGTSVMCIMRTTKFES